jgi:predicted O-methyltransferase YrrM
VDSTLRAHADAILATGRAHDGAQSDRLARFRNLEPETAEMLALLVRATRPERLLELGTSNGYSTLWLADAARTVGARLVSVERAPERVALARENLRGAGLEAELLVADAGRVLRDSAAGEWEFVFLDAERSEYSGYWQHLLRALAPAGVLAIDNVLSHADELVALSAMIESEATVTTAVIPIGAGVRLVVKDSP